MRLLFLFLTLCFSPTLFAQQIEVLIVEDPPYMMDQDINVEIYLINSADTTLTYFDSRGPSWNSFKEVWDMNVNGQYFEILPLNGSHNHNFPDSTIITLQSGDTNLIRTHVINLKTAGMYSFTYTQEQAADFVEKKFADASVSDSLLQNISTFKVSKNIKFEVFKEYDTTITELNTMSWDEWQEYRNVKLYSRKKHFNNLNTALRHPQDVYSLKLYCDGLSADDIKRIARLKNLRALTLRDYELDFFPAELTELNLFELTLVPKEETVISFPGGLSKDNSIRELTAKFYAGIPGYVLSLKNLMFLDVSDCPIKTLPMLDSLQNLEVFYAKNAQISKLSQVGFNHLLKLKELDLSGNKDIDDLTPLLTCTSLEFLMLNRTSIQTIPDAIENLNKLKKLTVSNGLTAISDSIGKLEDMRYLSFGGNRKLDSIPQSITNMKKLLHLDVSSTKIDQLPEGISELPLEKVMIYNTNCLITKDYKVLKNRLKDNFKD